MRAFDRSPFKLFTLRFLSKSMQAPSCEKPKTTQQTLFLSFEINNCFPITYSVGGLWKILETCMPRGKFKHRYWYFADTPNIGRSNSVIWKDLWWGLIFTVSQITGRMYNTDVTIKCMMWKVCPSQHFSVIGKQLFFANNRNRGSLGSIMPLTGWGLQWFVWKFQQEPLKGRPIE